MEALSRSGTHSVRREASYWPRCSTSWSAPRAATGSSPYVRAVAWPTPPSSSDWAEPGTPRGLPVPGGQEEAGEDQHQPGHESPGRAVRHERYVGQVVDHDDGHPDDQKDQHERPVPGRAPANTLRDRAGVAPALFSGRRTADLRGTAF